MGAPLPRRRGAPAPPGPGLAVRIIAGSRKGARIFAPKGPDTRPTADRVREAAFNLLGPGAAEDATVLDLFAGSGAMGLEALSRGAVHATFVENDREACRTINRNVDKLGLDIPPKERRGLVLIDPPFEQPDEFRHAAEALIAAHRKWPTGAYQLWYPIKDRREPDRLARSLVQAGIPKLLRSELLVDLASAGERLAGSGMILVNPPWRLHDELAILIPALAALLGRDAAGQARLDRLSGEQ